MGITYGKQIDNKYLAFLQDLLTALRTKDIQKLKELEELEVPFFEGECFNDLLIANLVWHDDTQREDFMNVIKKKCDQLKKQ